MEKCEAHGDLMQTIGEVRGTVKAIREDQMKMRDQIGKLFDRIDDVNAAHTKALAETEREQSREVAEVRATTTRFFLKLIGLVAILSSAVSSVIATYLKNL